MKVFVVTILAILVFIVGCVTHPTRVVIEDSEEFNAPFDKVWDALVATISELSLPIKAVEKDSGILATESVTFADGYSTDRELKQVATYPTGFLTRERAAYRLSIYAEKLDQNITRVRITSNIQVLCKSMGEYTWYSCHSNGTIERNLFSSIKQKIGTTPFFGIKPDLTQPGTDGLIIEEVIPNTSAGKGGVRVGDVLIEFNNIKITSWVDFRNALGGCKIGQTVKTKLKRGDETLELEIVLEKMP